MAVPKKRVSRTKTKSRKANWLAKARLQVKKAWSIANSAANPNSKSFYFEKQKDNEKN